MCPLHYLLSDPTVLKVREEKVRAGLLVGRERKELP